MDKELRAAVERGLHVENLWAIVRLCAELLRSERTAQPSIVYAIKSACRDLAEFQEGIAVSTDAADLIDTHVGLAMERVLDSAGRDPTEILTALNQLATACAEATRP
jgi:hypothetical protein